MLCYFMQNKNVLNQTYMTYMYIYSHVYLSIYAQIIKSRIEYIFWNQECQSTEFFQSRW